MRDTPDSEGFYRELRTDLLKLRGYLYDPQTRLPSLPAVVDGVRRRLEDGAGVGVVYLDPSSGGELEPAFGWQAYDEVIRTVAAALDGYRREYRETIDAVAQLEVRGDEFVVFVDLPADDPTPARTLERARRALVERVRAALAAHIDGEHHAVPLESAAIQLELDPTLRIERSISRSLRSARDLCRERSEERHSGRAAELRRMIREGDVTNRFQPIMDLATGVVHGFEALSAAPSRQVFESPEMLFAFAEESDQIVDLERLCCRHAIERGGPLLAPSGRLFLNCSAHAFADPQLVVDLAHRAAERGLEPGRLVVELTERVAITEWRLFRRALGDLRRAGLRVAIDDMGSGYSSLHTVAEIEPEYLKFDSSLVHGIHRSPIKRDMLETLVMLSRKIGALPIAEGIEELEELDTVRSMGVTYGQGYLFAHPEAAESITPARFPGKPAAS